MLRYHYDDEDLSIIKFFSYIFVSRINLINISYKIHGGKKQGVASLNLKSKNNYKNIYLRIMLNEYSQEINFEKKKELY